MLFKEEEKKDYCRTFGDLSDPILVYGFTIYLATHNIDGESLYQINVFDNVKYTYFLFDMLKLLKRK